MIDKNLRNHNESNIQIQSMHRSNAWFVTLLWKLNGYIKKRKENLSDMECGFVSDVKLRFLQLKMHQCPNYVIKCA